MVAIEQCWKPFAARDRGQRGGDPGETVSAAGRRGRNPGESHIPATQTQAWSKPPKTSLAKYLKHNVHFNGSC